MTSKEKAIEIVTKCIKMVRKQMKVGQLSVVESLCNDDNDYEDYRIVCVCGGENGRGSWSNYFEILAKLMFEIEVKLKDKPIMLNVKNDVADDVFYVYIGIPKFSDII